MISWKEKVADKLSRLLADSPSFHSRVARESPAVRSEPQAFPLSAEELSSHERSSFSSLLLSLLPTTGSNNDQQKLTKPGNQHGFRPIPLQSLPMRWKNKGFTWEGRSLDQNADCGLENTCNEPTEIPEDILDHVPERNTGGFHGNEAAPISHGLRNFLSDVVDQSSFISSHLFEFLESSIPNLVKGCQWVLLYSTMKHGISLHTLIRKSADLPGPCLLVRSGFRANSLTMVFAESKNYFVVYLLGELWFILFPSTSRTCKFRGFLMRGLCACQIVGDMQGAVFGGLLDAPLKPTAKRKYQGTSQSFVFTTIYGDPRLFRPTGANRYYYLCLNELLAFGGGGSFALCLDEDLLHGTSGPSDTFGNLCLAYSPEFELRNVELWGFTHPSSYLT